MVVLRTSSYIPPFAAKPPKIASRSPSGNYLLGLPGMKDTSAQVTTRPEKNIFGSGEKLLGLSINSQGVGGVVLLQNRSSGSNLNPAWL